MDARERPAPGVSDWARPYVEPEEAEYEAPQRPPSSRSSLMDQVRAQQASYRERERKALSAAKWNFWPGLAMICLNQVPYHIGTVLAIIGVLLCALGTGQWFEALCDRRAARAFPDPEDLARF